eukprot:snap_masked-scaffold_3-processed-gene-13.15-mRNA-1 protein AED:1.00 eAED:1.00 QI:0/-1/0/0/-1/1/1/0/93
MTRTVQAEARSIVESSIECLEELVTYVGSWKSISRFIYEGTPLQTRTEIYVLNDYEGTVLVENTDGQAIRPLNLEVTSDLEIKLNIKYIGSIS